MVSIDGKNFGRMIKRQRVMVPLTLRELSARSGVSPSHLGRIERGERFPSARTLGKVAKPLGFDEHELFVLASYLSNQSPAEAERLERLHQTKRLDPYMADVLAQQLAEVQHTISGILSVLKSLAEGIQQE